MRIFIGGVMQASITGKGIVSQGYRRQIAEALAGALARGGDRRSLRATPGQCGIRRRQGQGNAVRQSGHAAASDLLIAYVPTASMGTALEMYVAHQRGVPVVTITPLAENWVVRALSRRVYP